MVKINTFLEGYNLKFTNLQASLGLEQLITLRWRIKRLREIYKFYKKNIKQNHQFKLLKFSTSDGELLYGQMFGVKIEINYINF